MKYEEPNNVGDGISAKAYFSSPTEPKKTVEKMCRCKQFGKECCLACKVTGSCLCGMNREGNISSTPIQTGNDEWEEEFNEQFGTCNGGDALYAIIDDDGLSIKQYLKHFIRTVEQKAVLQERERATKILNELIIKYC